MKEQEEKNKQETVEKKPIEKKETTGKEKNQEKPAKDKKKAKEEEKKPKEKAIVNGKSLAISSKDCFAICRQIKGKTPEQAAEFLQEVVNKKKAIKMPRREIGHRKGKGISSGRYPKKACLEIINLIRQLKANSIINGIENPVIFVAKADKASRPYRREGRRTKRTHIYLEAREKKSSKTNKKLKTENKTEKKKKK
jgi:ribosomal protein L22